MPAVEETGGGGRRVGGGRGRAPGKEKAEDV
jgi:hypothetical protein